MSERRDEDGGSVPGQSGGGELESNFKVSIQFSLIPIKCKIHVNSPVSLSEQLVFGDFFLALSLKPLALGSKGFLFLLLSSFDHVVSLESSC